MPGPNPHISTMHSRNNFMFRAQRDYQCLQYQVRVVLNYILIFQKCAGWARASPQAQLVFIFLYGEIRDTRVYISPVLLPLCARASPTNRYANVRGKVGSIVCSLTQSIHFLSYLVFSNQIFQFCPLDFDKMKERRANSESKEPQAEELNSFFLKKERESQ